ncbi:hypothetical protein C8R46DRAFT_1056623, partial [Mycena filopes]
MSSEKSRSSGSRHSRILPAPSEFAQLRELLRSHSLPSATVASSLRDFIEKSGPELQRLRKTQRALESYRKGCLSVFSPVRRLPTELLAEIFGLCAPSSACSLDWSDSPTRELNRVARKYLLDLSRVCSRWHEVAMNTPKLWSTVVFDALLWPGCAASPDVLLSLVVVGLQRSGDHPLSLDVAVGDDAPLARQILHLIAKKSPQWEKVRLWAEPEAFRYLTGARGRMPVLQTLSLVGSLQNDYRYYTDDIFEIAPRLREVSISGWPSQLPKLPWQSLLKLTYDNRGADHLTLAMLPKLQQEVHCDISLNPSNLPIPLNFSPITAHISSLLLELYGGRRYRMSELLITFLESVTLPGLRHLVLSAPADSEVPDWSQQHFLDFAARSSLCSSLTMLWISALIEDRELINCLAVLPLLQELHIWDHEDHVVMTDTLLNSLNWSADETNLVPRLNSMHFNSAMTFSDTALLDFVTSRAVLGRFDPGVIFEMVLISISSDADGLSPTLAAQLSGLEERAVFAWGYSRPLRPCHW